MNTCRAGAVLTTRSKRGSTGAPGTLGISARSGGSSASRTAFGWLPFCAVALSISEITDRSTWNGAQEPSRAAAIAARLVRFTVLLLLLAGVVSPRGRPVSLEDRRIELDGFSRLGSLQYDLLVRDLRHSGVPVVLAEFDRPPVDRHLAAGFGDDHDLHGRRALCGLIPVGGSAENFQRRPRGIVQSLRKAARRAERDDERETHCQISSHVLSGLNV